ncbi:DNA polymerase I [Chlamydia ibidis]|uniref:DNA polymerase I n=2 Tax=Chlamydia ibidis TaxID=1405396 RepID=S7J3A5_9CHLA|nr:DNA polymerase I [Chlamydia ibidis]EPP34889.1 DNA polymerase I [Chlamydia ibidis]EQM62879.1 DNA polymerase I [Chlamydia ibidis 10-1398/6]
MRKVFVLDASGFIFRAYFALPEMKNSSGDPTQAVFGFIRSINKLVKDFSPSHMVAVFDGPDNKKSRRDIFAEYKSHREKVKGMMEQITLVKEYCDLVGLPYLEVDSVEADDVIASLSKQIVDQGYNVCICSTDKDLLQLVSERVTVLNPWKKQEIVTRQNVIDSYGVPPECIADYLALVGDTSDNIPGVSGCGPKKAATLLQKFGSVEGILENIEGLSGANRTMIEEQQAILKMSKQLAQLNYSISIPKSCDSFVFPQYCVDQDKLNAFYMRQGFKTFVRKGDKETTYSEIERITDPQELSRILNSLKGKEVAFSVSYLGKSLLTLEMFGVALTCGDGNVYYVDLVRYREEMVPILQCFFAHEDTYFYGYNIKRDNHALRNSNIYVKNIIYDLALADHLVHGGAKISYQTLLVNQGLIDAASLFVKEWSALSLPVTNFPNNVAQYFGEFVAHLPKTKDVLLSELDQKKMRDIFLNVEMPLEKVLFSMERAGMPINILALEELEEILSRELVVISDEIYALAGEVFNIKSPKQLSDILYNILQIKPVDKSRSTKAEVLEMLMGEHPIIDKILCFRTVEKLLSTYVKALPKQIDPNTQRIHPTFNQTGTVTGRLACQDPNLQNIPTRSERGRLLRKAFCTGSEDKYFLSADYSQIELRFLAHLSGDDSLRLAFESGEDIHTFTASQVFHVPLDEVTREQRKQAKTVNFGIIYGQQAYGLSKILHISVGEAQGLIEAYFERYPKVLEFINHTIEQASQDLRVTTLLGRERIIDNWKELSGSRSASGRLAVNTRIQGSAAELIKLAMLQISSAMKKHRLKSRMLLQIHDELLFEVPENEMEQMRTLVPEIMESAMVLSVPLVVNILVGKNWAEC